MSQKNKGCSLLVVDDNPWENQFTEMILRDIPDVAGYRFFAAGWQAFNYLDVCRTGGTFPDVILVDLLMEDMTGFAWIEHFEREFWPAPATLSHPRTNKRKAPYWGFWHKNGFLP